MSVPLGVQDIKCVVHVLRRAHRNAYLMHARRPSVARVLVMYMRAYQVCLPWTRTVRVRSVSAKGLVRPRLHPRALPYCPLCTIRLFPWLVSNFIATGYIVLALAAVIGHCCAYTALPTSSYLCSLGSAAVVVSATAWSAILVCSIVYRQVISHTLKNNGVCPTAWTSA